MQRAAVLPIALCLCAFTAAEVETAHQRALASRDAFWQCLAEEAVRLLPSQISSADFSLYVKGACPDSAQIFRQTMSNYLGMKFPDMAIQTHLSEADRAIDLGRADIVKFFVSRRAGLK